MAHQARIGTVEPWFDAVGRVPKKLWLGAGELLEIVSDVARDWPPLRTAIVLACATLFIISLLKLLRSCVQ